MGLQKASLILALACTFTNVQAQFTNGDFTINTVGLSDDYAQRFKQEETVEVLVSMFNRLGITPEISPVKISVVYDRTGTVVAEFNYDHERIFSRGTDYLTHNDNWKGWGDGISVYLQDQVFLALGQFKKSAASDGWAMDRELLNFESEVRLINSDGNWVRFFGYDRMDYNGWYKFMFYTNAQINYDGFIYEVETSNSKMLNEMKFFFVGKSIGLDGSKTGAYYFSRFFKFSEEDKKILEEKKRKEEERKREEQKRKEEHARIEAEKRRQQKELEWKEKVLFSKECFFSSQLSNKSEIYLTVKSDILEDLHHFVEYFQKKYSSGYYQKERQYEHILKYAEANGNEPEDYSLLDLLLCFGKDRSLSK
jgi:hypothetical protein